MTFESWDPSLCIHIKSILSKLTFNWMAVLTRKTVTIYGFKCKVYSCKPRPVNDLEVQISEEIAAFSQDKRNIEL